MNDQKPSASRGAFVSKTGFILAAAGSAVGLGNIWRFPYMTGMNGGGAFVLVYIIAVALLGIPLLLVEFTIGRHGKVNAIDCYRKINEKTKFIGYIGFFSAPLFLAYYSVTSGWTIFYTIKSFTGLTSIPAEGIADFFFSFVANPWKPLIFHFIFTALTVYIIARGIQGGIEKYSKILMPILFGFLIVLMVRSLTLPGAAKGIAWFLKPDFSKITPGVIVAASGQIFFSLSVGMSGMLTYASYLKGDENLLQTAGIVTFFDTLVALMAGLVIFPAVFTYGLEPAAGPSLIFMTLPTVFGSMPLGSFFAFVFFALLIVANLTSSISILEMPVAYLIEKKGMTRPKAAILVGAIGFGLGCVVSLGYGAWSFLSINDMTVLDIFDYIGSNIVLPFCALASAIVCGWVWNKGAFQEISNNGLINLQAGKVWLALVRYVVPVLMFLVFLGQVGVISLG